MNLLSFFSKHPVPVTILAGPFQGSHLILNPSYSKRKILGIYEYVLNPWLKQVMTKVNVVWDVGANDGYFTYGCAQLIKHHHQIGNIIAFEPDLEQQSALSIPSNWTQYAGIEFEFLPLFVSSISSDSTITLEKAYQERPKLHNKPSLIKVDVEGAEIDVLKGANSLLDEPHHWVVEVHGDHLLEPVINFFNQAKRPIDIHIEKPHWLLGAETRTIKTSWITTKL